MIDVIVGADYDVSYDGKKWFHAFGSHCYKKCPPLRLIRP
jgi:hypothetical protein